MNDLMEIIAKVLHCNEADLNENTELHQLTIDSLIFIQIVVEIELKYNIEFENDALLYEKYTNILDIWEYVSDKLSHL